MFSVIFFVLFRFHLLLVLSFLSLFSFPRSYPLSLPLSVLLLFPPFLLFSSSLIFLPTSFLKTLSFFSFFLLLSFHFFLFFFSFPFIFLFLPSPFHSFFRPRSALSINFFYFSLSLLLLFSFILFELFPSISLLLYSLISTVLFLILLPLFYPRFSLPPLNLPVNLSSIFSLILKFITFSNFLSFLTPSFGLLNLSLFFSAFICHIFSINSLHTRPYSCINLYVRTQLLNTCTQYVSLCA